MRKKKNPTKLNTVSYANWPETPTKQLKIL